MSDLAFLDFEELVARAVDDPAATEEAWRRFGTRAAVLVADFTGMVRRTNARGIVYALGRAQQAQVALGLSGTPVKRVADTVFMLYPTAEAALLDALDSHRRLAAERHQGDDPIHACIGLGFGDCLLVSGVDVFGPEVNHAFVLGEDVAGGGEVLASVAFMEALGAPPAGVGVFRAPEERETEAGFPFHVLKDYR